MWMYLCVDGTGIYNTETVEGFRRGPRDGGIGPHPVIVPPLAHMHTLTLCLFAHVQFNSA